MMSMTEDTDTPDSQYLVASSSRMPWSFRSGKSSFLRGTSRFTFKACSELELVSKTLCLIVNIYLPHAYQMARHSTAGNGRSPAQMQKCLISSTRCAGILLYSSYSIVNYAHPKGRELVMLPMLPWQAYSTIGRLTDALPSRFSEYRRAAS